MINFIKTSIENIKRAKLNNKLVVFVGAGVSSNSNFPSWFNLVKDIGDKLGMPDPEGFDDYLKFPQIYFNQRGEKEYYDLINHHFDIDVKPNWIHKEILNLDPVCIITTNFDELIEASVKIEKETFHVIKRNEDLPYTFNDKMIIKMHGDLKLRNIVLKEDDYLSYSNNFKLVENYIKSLFSTKLVLFIGYSGTDIDFKIMVQWVKDILKDNFQPIYLLETAKNPNPLVNDYYKKKGINILNYYIIEEDIAKIKPTIKINKFIKPNSKRGIDLFNFIKYINVDLNKEDIIDSIYLLLKPYSDIPFLKPQNLIDEISLGHFSNGYIILGDKNIISFLQKMRSDKIFRRLLLKEHKEELKTILSVIKRTGIKGVKDSITNILFEWENDYLTTFVNDLDIDYYKFDFKSIHKKILNNIQLLDYEGHEFEILGYSFYLYKMGDYLSSIKILKDLSSYAFDQNKYWLYYIAEFNRKHMGTLLTISGFRTNNESDNIQELISELKAIDLERLYSKIPKSKNSKMFSDLQSLNFIYVFLKNIDKTLSGLENDKELLENNGFSINNNFSELHNNYLIIWNYINKNYLFIDHYSEVKIFYEKYIRGIFLSYYNTNKGVSNEHLKMFGPYSGLVKFNYYLLWNTINYSESKALEKTVGLLNKVKIKIVENEINDLIKSFNNLIEYSIEKFTEGTIEKIKNYFIIFNKLEIDKEIIIKIIEIIIQNNIVYRLVENEYFNDFLLAKTRKIKNDKRIIEIINKIITIILREIGDNKINIFAFKRISEYNLIANLIIIIGSDNIDSEINESILLTISKNIELYKNNIDELLCYTVFPLLSTTKIKTLYKKLVSDILSDNNKYGLKISSPKMLEILFYSIFYKIFVNKKDYNLFYTTLNQVIDEYKVKKTFPDQIALGIDYLMRLIIWKGFDVNSIPREYLNNFMSHSQILSFIVAPKKFKMEEFNLKWILYLDKKYFAEYYKLHDDLNSWKEILDKTDYDEKHKYRIIKKIIDGLKK